MNDLIHKVRFILFAVACYSPCLNAQTLFPGLEGEELQEALRDEYRPNTTLSLAQAKDTLYEVIDNEHDSVACIYSGYTLVLPDGVDASQWLFMNGDGLNLEHVFPQSKGADEGMPGHSNMHHLYPSRVDVNEARGSNPFADIPDNVTTSWYRDHLTLHSIPGAEIDAYSEYRKGLFEPRESVKGNIARAVFYFYTMYKEDADAADPNFFATQRLSLCQWHLNDPSDEAERTRSQQVAEYQEGRENPFVLDCTAALRAWCPEFQGCNTTYVSNAQDATTFMMNVFVNVGHINVHFNTQKAQDAILSIFDVSGRLLLSSHLHLEAGSTDFTPPNVFLPGLYVISCITSDEHSQLHITRCIVEY